jgi:hypothetical protein
MSIFDDILSSEPNRKDSLKAVATPQDYDTDPRPDLNRDHQHWVKILTNAKEINGGETSLYKILHGIRCGGGQIEETIQAYKLLPGNEDWVKPGEWEKIRRTWLDPVKDALVQLFKTSKVGMATKESLPPGVFDEEKSEDKPKETLSWKF